VLEFLSRRELLEFNVDNGVRELLAEPGESLLRWFAMSMHGNGFALVRLAIAEVFLGKRDRSFVDRPSEGGL
jgi:hypothetical protein